jgi:hypothetical protein
MKYRRWGGQEHDAVRRSRRLRPTVTALEGRALLTDFFTVSSTQDNVPDGRP